MDKEQKTQYWQDMAGYDLETARAMLSTGRYLYVGFMCHQTVEKSLKAYYNDEVCDDIVKQTEEFFEWINRLLKK
ncbi:MAG TPA: HEPN domain-containing protein [Spirochaetes bacterium]|nr:HEPN domain-containing protein [Spirochaetota bacterium]